MKRALAFTLMVLAIMIIAVSCDEPHVHSFSNEWTSDSVYHWHASACGHEEEVSDKEAHKWKGGDEDGWIVDVASTETEQGKKHRECSVCGYNEEGKVPLKGHVHTYSSYGKDSSKHWRTCTGCGETFTYSHTFSYVDAGAKHYEKCYLCGYSKSQEDHVYTDKKVLKGDSKIYKICDLCDNSGTEATNASDSSTVVAAKVEDLSEKKSADGEVTVTENGKEVTKKVKVINEDVAITVAATAETGTSTKNQTTVTFPSGALKVDKDATSVSLIVETADISAASKEDSGYQITTSGNDADTGAVVAGFEFNLSNAVASDLTVKDKYGNITDGVEIKTYIAKNLTENSLSIKYLGESSGKEPTITSYKPGDGELVFKVYHFSRYAIVADGIVATDSEGKMYASLDGGNGALSKVEDGKTITLLKNVKLSSALTVNKTTLTIDLNGKVLNCGERGNRTTMTAVNVVSGKTLTLKNGEISYYGKNDTSYIIKNAGTLTTKNLIVNAYIEAECDISMTEIGDAISDSNSCPTVALVTNSGTLTDTSSTLEMIVSLVNNESIKSDNTKFAGVKPIVIYMTAGSTATLTGSTLKATTYAPGGVLGLYALSSSGSGITATLDNSNVTLENNSFGWTRPVFADGRNKDAKITMTLKKSTISSVDNLTNTMIPEKLKESLNASYNRAYGLRATGNSEISADATTIESTSVIVKNDGATKITLAGELSDYVEYGDDWKYCGKVVDSSNKEVGVMTAKDKASLEKDIQYAREGATILLLDDIDLQLSEVSEKKPALTINKSLTINGNNNKLYNDSKITNKEVQMITVTGLTKDDEVTLKNIKIVSSKLLPSGRGIQIEDSKNAKINLENVTVSLPNYYGIYVVNDYDESILNITNESKISAWSAIYNHASNFTVEATDSEFVSVNKQTNGGESNSFSGILVSEYYDSAEPSMNNNMTFTNCTFTAKITHPNTDVTQQIADLRNPCGNTLTLKSCDFNPAKGSQYFLSCYDSTYERNEVDERYKGTNKIIVDDEDISFSDKVTWYLDASECEEGVYHIEYKNTDDASLAEGNAWTNWYFRCKSKNSHAVTLPVLTKTGYTFGGWYTDKTFTESTKKTGIGAEETGHFTLYAKWTSDDASV